MSVGKKISKAIAEADNGDFVEAFSQICIAIDATAQRHYAQAGKKSFKDFIGENMGLITKASFGRRILNMNLALDHPRLPKQPNGACRMQDILYHAVRCQLLHDAELPENLKFQEPSIIEYQDNTLIMPRNLVFGLMTAVIVCPSNSSERAEEACGLNVGGLQLRVNTLWGKRDQLEQLYSAIDALQSELPYLPPVSV